MLQRRGSAGACLPTSPSRLCRWSVRGSRRPGAVVTSFPGRPRGAGQGPWPLSGRLFLGGAPRARRRPVPRQRVPGPVRLVRPYSGVWPGPVASLSCPSAEVVWGCLWLPVGRSPWLTCVGVSRDCLAWVCLVWLAFVWPQLFAFRRPCCSARPSSLSVTMHLSRVYLSCRIPANSKAGSDEFARDRYVAKSEVFKLRENRITQSRHEGSARRKSKPRTPDPQPK
jgi:hypothetical protein